MCKRGEYYTGIYPGDIENGDTPPGTMRGNTKVSLPHNSTEIQKYPKLSLILRSTISIKGTESSAARTLSSIENKDRFLDIY